MAEWLVCPTCHLKHSVRTDRTCPRCRESVDRSSSAGTTAAPVPAPANAAGRLCASCGFVGPTARVEYHQNVGALVMRFHKSVKGEVCPDCARKHFRDLTLTTLVGGWWGVHSFLLTPIYVVSNLIQYLSYRPSATVAAAEPFARRRSLLVASVGIVLTGVLVYATVAGWASSHPNKPGKAAFARADAAIASLEGQSAFGNTPAATALAARLGQGIAEATGVAFRRDDGRGASSAGGRFVTYGELHGSRVCFLVHVPEMASYRGAKLDNLLRYAWLAAQAATQDLRMEKVAVALRGEDSYGALAIGPGGGTPEFRMGAAVDESALYDFFLDGPSVAAAELR